MGRGGSGVGHIDRDGLFSIIGEGGVGDNKKIDRRISDMPIKRERKKLYPPHWDKISRFIIEKAGERCELCGAGNGSKHWKTGHKVVLTVHHINHDPTDNRKINLIALCQRCHLRLDKPYRDTGSGMDLFTKEGY